jgi:hypothetical protein
LGLKVTVAEQLPEAQLLLEMENSLPNASDTERLDPADPGICAVTVCVEELDVGTTPNAIVAGAEPIPTPLRGIWCGDPVPSSTIWTVAVRVPGSNGENLTVILQLAPAASSAGQVVSCSNSLAFAPESWIAEIMRAVDELFIKV